MDGGFEKLLEHHIKQTQQEHERLWEAIIVINGKLDRLIEAKGVAAAQSKLMTIIISALMGGGVSVIAKVLMKS